MYEQEISQINIQIEYAQKQLASETDPAIIETWKKTIETLIKTKQDYEKAEIDYKKAQNSYDKAISDHKSAQNTYKMVGLLIFGAFLYDYAKKKKR